MSQNSYQAYTSKVALKTRKQGPEEATNFQLMNYKPKHPQHSLLVVAAQRLTTLC